MSKIFLPEGFMHTIQVKRGPSCNPLRRAMQLTKQTQPQHMRPQWKHSEQHHNRSKLFQHNSSPQPISSRFRSISWSQKTMVTSAHQSPCVAIEGKAQHYLLCRQTSLNPSYNPIIPIIILIPWIIRCSRGTCELREIWAMKIIGHCIDPVQTHCH